MSSPFRAARRLCTRLYDAWYPVPCGENAEFHLVTSSQLLDEVLRARLRGLR